MLYENTLTILPEWIDENGHMNVAYYVLAFDMGTDSVYEDWLVGHNYKEQGFSVFTMGMNVDYVSELFAGDTIRMTTQLVDWDYKRIHYFHQMFNESTGMLAATNECLCTNVDFKLRKSAPFPEHVSERLSAVYQQHAQLPIPDTFGRKLQIRRK